MWIISPLRPALILVCSGRKDAILVTWFPLRGRGFGWFLWLLRAVFWVRPKVYPIWTPFLANTTLDCWHPNFSYANFPTWKSPQKSSNLSSSCNSQTSTPPNYTFLPFRFPWRYTEGDTRSVPATPARKDHLNRNYGTGKVLFIEVEGQSGWFFSEILHSEGEMYLVGKTGVLEFVFFGVYHLL